MVAKRKQTQNSTPEPGTQLQLHFSELRDLLRHATAQDLHSRHAGKRDLRLLEEDLRFLLGLCGAAGGVGQTWPNFEAGWARCVAYGPNIFELYLA